MHYGYARNQVAYTGFARFDNYFNFETKNQVLVMPTWRRYAENVNFVETDYYKVWSSFLNSRSLSELLESSNVVMYFYLHPHFKDFASFFKTCHPNIKILNFQEADLQTLIIESKLLITDFSSLAFDFGYMRKPVIYYQYDEEEYFKHHYIKGYFDYRRDGFGPVCTYLKTLEESLRNYLGNSFLVENKFLTNAKKFFPVFDSKNSERIYNSILAL